MLSIFIYQLLNKAFMEYTAVIYPYEYMNILSVLLLDIIYVEYDYIKMSFVEIKPRNSADGRCRMSFTHKQLEFQIYVLMAKM